MASYRPSASLSAPARRLGSRCVCVCKFVLGLLFFLLLGGEGCSISGRTDRDHYSDQDLHHHDNNNDRRRDNVTPIPLYHSGSSTPSPTTARWCTERHCTYASPARVVASSNSDPRASPVCCASVCRFSLIARPTCLQITIPHNHGNDTHAHGDGSPFVFNKGGITPRVRKQRTDRNAFVHESQSGG